MSTRRRSYPSCFIKGRLKYRTDKSPNIMLANNSGIRVWSEFFLREFLRDCLNASPEFEAFFQSTGPGELSFVSCNIRATITHALTAVG
jgi:hypothetical protein